MDGNFGCIFMNELLHCSASSRALVPRRRCLVLAGFTLKPAPATVQSLIVFAPNARSDSAPSPMNILTSQWPLLPCSAYIICPVSSRFGFAHCLRSRPDQNSHRVRGRRAPLKAARKLCTMTDRLGTLPRSSPPAISAIFLWPLRGVWVWAVGVYTVSQGEGGARPRRDAI